MNSAGRNVIAADLSPTERNVLFFTIHLAAPPLVSY
jgi:hypothetical protein